MENSFLNNSQLSKKDNICPSIQEEMIAKEIVVFLKGLNIQKAESILEKAKQIIKTTTIIA